ncbi:L-rhamnonate dehydratase [Candidatus Bathyarchaeota archaeon B24-2]|nr:MAG: L-rhamnonate dehydratase [Candidatus Bathyarchaeota archaeon B24-2]
MRIKEVSTWRLKPPKDLQPESEPRRPSWVERFEIANPMSRYPRYKKRRSSWLPRWGNVWVKVVAEDGTFGLGFTSFDKPVAAIIKEHIAPLLIGEDCLAIGRLWDMMFRMTKPYGTSGLACCAISAVDLALWDLAGKIRGEPVYRLIGGPARDKVFTYATGNDVDWYLELGFKAVKLACPYGPVDGVWGLKENEKLVAETRELVGDDVEVMLDCYMAFDVEYTIRLARRLKPYNLRWIEECLIPEDIDGYAQIKQAVNWVSLASGEHLYTRWPFKQLIERRCLDILQPDIHWVGGLTECLRICAMAEAAGLTVILHGGGNDPYGLHLTYAMPNTPWIEYVIFSPPGVPLEESCRVPLSPVPKNGYMKPTDEPGFGLKVEEEWLEPL